MTDATTLAIIGIVPPALLALTGLVVALTNARHIEQLDVALQRHSNADPAAIVPALEGGNHAKPTAG